LRGVFDGERTLRRAPACVCAGCVCEGCVCAIHTKVGTPTNLTLLRRAHGGVAGRAKAIIEDDMAKARELEARLQRTEQQLALFQKISRFMVRDLSLPDVLKGFVFLVVEFTHCALCLLFIYDGESLGLCASHKPHHTTLGDL